MRIVIYVFLVIITVGLLGFGAYHWFSGQVAERASVEVEERLSTSEYGDEARQLIEGNPVIKEFVQEGETIDLESAELQTTEEAIQVIIDNFNPVELVELRSQAEDGLDQAEQEEIISKLESNLTEEELQAIKAIAYEELYQ